MRRVVCGLVMAAALAGAQSASAQGLLVMSGAFSQGNAKYAAVQMQQQQTLGDLVARVEALENAGAGMQTLEIWDDNTAVCPSTHPQLLACFGVRSNGFIDPAVKGTLADGRQRCGRNGYQLSVFAICRN